MNRFYRFLSRVAGSFQPAADRIQAMELPEGIKEVFADMSKVLPKYITTAFLKYLEDMIRKEKNKKVRDKSIKDMLIMLKGTIKF